MPENGATEKVEALAGEATDVKPTHSTLARIAGWGEDAFRRLREELESDDSGQQALQKVVDARGHLDKVSRSALNQMNLAPKEDLDAVKEQVALLEKRVDLLDKSKSRPRTATGDSEGEAAGA